MPVANDLVWTPYKCKGGFVVGEQPVKPSGIGAMRAVSCCGMAEWSGAESLAMRSIVWGIAFADLMVVDVDATITRHCESRNAQIRAEKEAHAVQEEVFKLVGFDRWNRATGHLASRFLMYPALPAILVLSVRTDHHKSVPDTFAKEVQERNLGHVAIAEPRRNVNSGNLVTAFLWSINADGFRRRLQWLQPNREG